MISRRRLGIYSISFLDIELLEDCPNDLKDIMSIITGIIPENSELRRQYDDFDAYVSELLDKGEKIYCYDASDNVCSPDDKVAYFLMDLTAFFQDRLDGSKLYAGFFSSGHTVCELKPVHDGKFFRWKGLILGRNEREVRRKLHRQFSPRRSFWEYIFMPDDKLHLLADMCTPEVWSFKGGIDYGILKNYIAYTFMKLDEEGKIFPCYGSECQSFNTGLFTYGTYQKIHAILEPNRNPGKQAMFLKEFCDEMRGLRKYQIPLKRDDRADYFEEPENLIFNPRCEIVPNYEHIIVERRDRWPNSLKGKTDDELTDILMRSIEHTSRMMQANYKIAVPQYYPPRSRTKGKIQLLLPLYLENNDRPDIALVLERKGMIYEASTCLTLDMAYNNARLIVRPDSNWLCPENIML